MMIKKALLTILASTIPLGMTTSFTQINNENYDSKINFQENENNKPNSNKQFYFDDINFNSNLNLFDSTKKDLKKEIVYGHEYKNPAMGVFIGSGAGEPANSIEDIGRWTKVQKDEWYSKTSKSITLNYLDYADSKEDFINKYQYVTAGVFLMDNFWNGKKGWSWSGGGERQDFAYRTFKIKLTGQENKPNSTLVWHNTDPNHSNNETTHVELLEEWDTSNNTFSLSWKILASVHWARGSIYNHSAIIKLRSPQFYFRDTEKSNTTNFIPTLPDEVTENRNFKGGGTFAGLSVDLLLLNTKPNSSNEVISLPLFNSADLVGKKNYREILAVNQAFVFSTIDITLSTKSLFLFSAPNSLISLDLNLLLNQEALVSEVAGGTLAYNITSSYSFFSYTSKIFGLTAISNFFPNEATDAETKIPMTWLGTSSATYYYEEN